MRVTQLSSQSFIFPSPELALREPNGLLALGGDLTAPRLLAAYQRGIFPWFNPGEMILWWSPDPRAVLFQKIYTSAGVCGALFVIALIVLPSITLLLM